MLTLVLSTGWTRVSGGGDYGKLINPGSALQAQRARLSDWFDRGTARTWVLLLNFYTDICELFLDDVSDSEKQNVWTAFNES
jgi:hypothetical protein